MTSMSAAQVTLPICGITPVVMQTEQHREGIPFIVSGPSGVGKDTIVAGAISMMNNIVRCVSTTTRQKGEHEVNGVDYNFVTKDAFLRMLAKGDLLEWAEVYGHFYGIQKGWLEERLKGGKDVFMILDLQGARAIRAQMPQAVSIFVMPPSIDALEMRLRFRGRDSEEVIARRLESAQAEMKAIDEYKYRLVNDDANRCITVLCAIITAERLGVDRK